MVGCASQVKRLSLHLQRKHKLNNTSPKYKSLLASAMRMGSRRLARFRQIHTEQVGLEQHSMKPEGLDPASEKNYDTISDESNVLFDKDSGDVEDEHEVHEDEEQLSVPHLLVSFKNWMVSPDGRKKDIKIVVKQHAA